MEKIKCSVNDSVKALPGFYGHIEDTEVFFEEENLYVTVLKTGEVTFEDEFHTKLAEAFVKPNTDNDMHPSAYCKAENGKVKLYFSIVGYKDTYPNCDGEHDRWVEVCKGYDCLVFSASDKEIQCSKVDSLDK